MAAGPPITGADRRHGACLGTATPSPGSERLRARRRRRPACSVNDYAVPRTDGAAWLTLPRSGLNVRRFPRSRTLPAVVRSAPELEVRPHRAGLHVICSGRVTVAEELGAPRGLVGLADLAGGPGQRVQAAKETLVGLVRPRYRAVALPAVATQRVEAAVIAGARVGV